MTTRKGAAAVAAALTLSACASGAPAQRVAIDAPGAQYDNAQAAALLKVRTALDAKRPAEAIEDADQIIAHYERAHPPEKGRVYCARSQEEALLYVLTAAKDGVNAIALDATWSGAYFLKAFALVELNRLADAGDALERARTLSPQNSQFLSELAYVQLMRGDHKGAFATYGLAEAAAEFSLEDERITDLTRALRGQGFLLTDNGHLDEAEAKYRKCLELNPEDAAAKEELDYIAKLRRR